MTGVQTCALPISKTFTFIGSGWASTVAFEESSCIAIPQSSIVIPVMAVMSTNAGKSDPRGFEGKECAIIYSMRIVARCLTRWSGTSHFGENFRSN